MYDTTNLPSVKLLFLLTVEVDGLTSCSSLIFTEESPSIKKKKAKDFIRLPSLNIDIRKSLYNCGNKIHHNSNNTILLNAIHLWR